MPSVRIPTVLREHADDQSEVETSGDTVGEVLRALTDRYPDLEDRLFEDGELRGFVNVYVDDEDIRYIDGLDSEVVEDSRVAIMPAVAGGATAHTGRQPMLRDRASAAAPGAPGPAGGAGGSAG